MGTVFQADLGAVLQACVGAVFQADVGAVIKLLSQSFPFTLSPVNHHCTTYHLIA
jgi:hypothetical protein